MQVNTPNDLFYVRHHLPVPHIKAEDYRLYIEGMGGQAACTVGQDEWQPYTSAMLHQDVSDLARVRYDQPKPGALISRGAD